MPLCWRHWFGHINSRVVQKPPTMCCIQTAPSSQLQTEERARLKSTTLGTGDDRHNTVALHVGKKVIGEGEDKGGKLEWRMKLREESSAQQPTGPALTSLTHPHPLQETRPTAHRHGQQIRGFLTRSYRSKPLSSSGNDTVSYDISI